MFVCMLCMYVQRENEKSLAHVTLVVPSHGKYTRAPEHEKNLGNKKFRMFGVFLP